MENAATFNNEAGATLLADRKRVIYGEYSGPGSTSSVGNAGTIDKSAGTGTSYFYQYVSLTNTGTLSAHSGTLDLGTSLTNFSSATDTLTGGTYAVYDGATLEFNGADWSISRRASSSTVRPSSIVNDAVYTAINSRP